MNFAFSEEQEQLREAVRRFMEAKSPSSEVRRLMETTEGYDEAVWKQMAQELGLQSLHIPEAHGGQGFTFVELGIVLEEMGLVLLCAPYFSTVVLAADAIMNAGTEAQQGELLPGIASGETIAALAFTEPNGRWDASGITMEASGSGDSYQLSGTKMFVIDGHTANTIITVARLAGTSGEDGISFFAVDGDASGLTRTPLATMDQTRKPARLDCSDAYFHAAAENIQIHGGIGFTWEHDAHLYFKRAKSSEILLGDATYHRELLAQRIGI